MAKYNNGYENIKVTLIKYPGNDFAKNTYEFGRLSHDSFRPLALEYNETSNDCRWLIDKIIEGTTLPKYALQGQRLEFRIENISRICLAQLTRDEAIFASGSTGVFPLSQEFNIPMSLYNDESIMSKVRKAQELLEDAYVEACEKEIPTIESRYIGLHPQVISVTAAYTIQAFVRSCHSRTSSNFCDECNYVYRLMYRALRDAIERDVTDKNSLNLYRWLVPEEKCINDGFYTRERLFNSDFTAEDYVSKLPALNDWRKSGWKLELERMYLNGTGWLTEKEKSIIRNWKNKELRGEALFTTYIGCAMDVAGNLISTMDYYSDVMDRRNNEHNR